MHPEMLKIIRFLSYLRYGFSSTWTKDSEESKGISRFVA
jgi:hypothetical protein